MALMQVIPMGIILFLIITGKIEAAWTRRGLAPLPPPAAARRRPAPPARVVRTSLDERRARMLAWQEIEQIERDCGLEHGSLVQEP